MRVESYIATRIGSRGAGRNNIMVRLATATVALGLAVMVVSMAVIGGFRREITANVSGFSGDVRIVPLTASATLDSDPMWVDSVLIRQIEGVSGFRSMWRFALKGGILRTDEAISGIVLKGVGAECDMAFWRSHLVEGELPDLIDTLRHKDILISQATARQLNLSVSDRIELLFVTEYNPARRDRYRICGIYSTGMEEMDALMALTDIRNVQRILGWDGGQISGWEVNCADVERVRAFSESVYRTVFDPAWTQTTALKVEDVRSLYPALFDWLAAHRVNAAVIITIMIVVSLLNMIVALLIILLEKSSLIGVLKALGMSNGRVQRLFVYRSYGIIFRGMAWGNAIGITLALVQKYTHLIKLDSSGYMLSEIPISLDWPWLIALNLGVPLVLGLVMLFPVRTVSRIHPDKSMKYN